MRFRTSEIVANFRLSGGSQTVEGYGNWIPAGAKILGYSLRSSAVFGAGLNFSGVVEFGEIGGSIRYPATPPESWPVPVEVAFGVDHAPRLKTYARAGFKMVTGPTFVGPVTVNLWVNILALED